MLAAFSQWAIPLLFLGIPLAGWVRGVKLYEAFVRGAEQGFNTAVKIIPYLVGMMVAINVFRASGAMDLLSTYLGPMLTPLGLPPEVLPLAILRPLSGGAALGVAAELIGTHGPDSFLGRLASVMQGSTDTTFWLQIRCILAAKFLVGPGPVSTQGSNPWWRFQRNLCGPRAMASVLCLFEEPLGNIFRAALGSRVRYDQTVRMPSPVGRKPFDCG